MSLIINQWGFSRRSRTANSAVSDLIWPNFELIRDFIVVQVACKNGGDPIKMKLLKCAQCFPYYNPMGAICYHENQSSDPIWPKSIAAFPPTQ